MLHAVGVIAKGTGQFLRAIAQAIEFFGDRSQTRVHLRGLVQEVRAFAELVRHGLVAFVEHMFDLNRDLDQAFCVREDGSFPFQARVFLCFWICRLDFCDLKFQQLAAFALALGNRGFFDQPILQCHHLFVHFFDLCACELQVAKPVQKVQMPIRIEQGLMVVLPVQINQGAPQVPKHAHRNRQAIGIAPATAFCQHVAAHDQLALVCVNAYRV